jgi:hypothetical protein
LNSRILQQQREQVCAIAQSQADDVGEAHSIDARAGGLSGGLGRPARESPARMSPSLRSQALAKPSSDEAGDG